MNNNREGEKLLSILCKADKTVVENRINLSIYMLKRSSVEELTGIIDLLGKERVIEMLREIDVTFLQKLGIDVNEIGVKISNSDLDKLSQAIGNQGSEIVGRIKKVIK